MKEFLSAAAVLVTFILFVPYIRSIKNGETKPHVFSWVIWGLGTFIVFFAQLAGRGGLGAWPIGISGVISTYIAYLAYQKSGDTLITRADWAFLFAALSALPFWFFTSDPLWAVVTLTISDLIGFGPTVRRAYHHPHEESVVFFGLSALRNLLVVLALQHYSLTTVLFPAAVGLACLLFSLMLIYRGHLLRPQQRMKL
ncbi:MAG TPA: hypothetical protein VGB45_12025 [Abditibacterium sp.]|jgi:hypothetical protein